MSRLGLLMSFTLVVSVSASCCTPEKHTTSIRIDSFSYGTYYESKGVQYADVLNGVYVTHANYTNHKDVSTSSKSHFNIFTGDSFTVVGGHCIKTNFKIPGIKKDNANCIPDSEQGPTFSAGGPHEDLELFKVKTPLENGLLERTMTKHHCIPVFQTVYIKKKAQVTYAHAMFFSNFQPSVDDMSVFVLPDVCKHLI